jgi:MFS family permease
MGGRFTVGLGVGAMSMVCPTYVSELSPKHIRGRITGLFQVIVVIGVAGMSLHQRSQNLQGLINSFILDHLRSSIHRPSKRRYPMANPRRFPIGSSRNHGLYHPIHEGKPSMARYQAQE